MSEPSLEAVFFDAAGTLFSPRRPIGELYAAVAADYGFSRAGDDTAPEELQKSFRRVFARYEPLHQGRFPNGDRVAEERRWWRAIVTEAFEPVGSVAGFDDFFEALYAFFETAEAWRPEPGVEKALETFRAHGLQLGVISNFDSRLPTLLERLQLARFFGPVVHSSRVEAAKPAALIFETALREAGVQARHACHIGDRLRDDYQGARSAGLRAVLYDPWRRDVDAARISSWSEAASLLL